MSDNEFEVLYNGGSELDVRNGCELYVVKKSDDGGGCGVCSFIVIRMLSGRPP